MAAWPALLEIPSVHRCFVATIGTDGDNFLKVPESPEGLIYLGSVYPNPDPKASEKLLLHLESVKVALVVKQIKSALGIQTEEEESAAVFGTPDREFGIYARRPRQVEPRDPHVAGLMRLTGRARQRAAD